MNVAISRFHFSTVLLIGFLIVLMGTTSQVRGACNDPIYVDASASGTGSGTSWVNAMNSLQDGLSEAVTCGSSAVWVAAGVYKPDQGMAQTLGDRFATFQLVNGIAIYGGFPAGGGDGTFGARDIVANETILSGDLTGNDTPLACVNDSPDCDSNGNLCVDGFCIIAQNNAENSYHVVTGSGTISTAVIDGCTITAGNADGTFPFFESMGGGMFNNQGSPTVANCTFSRNSAVGSGGGMYNGCGSPTVTGCIFNKNSAGSGGGMSNGISSSIISNCIFSENSAGQGGGMLNNQSGSPTITNCIFSGNTASFSGGGMRSTNGNPSPTVMNSTFIGNTSDMMGGGMSFATSAPTLLN